MTPEEKLKALKATWDDLNWDVPHGEHCGLSNTGWECSCGLDKLREEMEKILNA